MTDKKFQKLPAEFQNEVCERYYNIIKSKRLSCILKRITDYTAAVVLFVLLIIPCVVIAIIIKATSKGPVLFCQTRVGKYGRHFKIYKFRTMITEQPKGSTQITVGKDPRITSVGHFLRKYRLDELPQVLNLLKGDMSIVGTRPEVPKYVEQYKDYMMATLLLRPGITGIASIAFKDESELLDGADDPEKVYVEKILPQKMKMSLEYIEKLSWCYDIKLMVSTVIKVK